VVWVHFSEALDGARDYGYAASLEVFRGFRWAALWDRDLLSADGVERCGFRTVSVPATCNNQLRTGADKGNLTV